MSLSRLPRMSGALAAALLAAGCQHQPPAATSAPATAQPPAYSDQDVSDAYVYLLSRLLVLRQQQLDFREGMQWNQLVHRKPGAVDWPNPNLDVAYSEAWVAVDEGSCTIVTVPRISGRYYTVQFLNGWGETLANINQRTYPDRPSGDFAACLKGSSVALPAGVRRIDLPARYTRVLSRVELGANWNQAVALQQQFKMRATGSPRLPQIPQTPVFDLQNLPGVEAFEAAEVAIQSEQDLNPGMEALQARTLAIARAVKAPAERARVDGVIRTRALPALAKANATIGPGKARNGWVRPAVSGAYGSDYLTRTLVNFGGIWANMQQEVIYYRGGADSTGAPLNSSNTYSLTFPRDQLPAAQAGYFWSVIAVDAKNFRVLPNPKNRFLINNQSQLRYNKDGSLTLYFGPQKPRDVPDGNWLPTPPGQDYRLTFRFYGPRKDVAAGTYFPPPLTKVP